jgi:hypothetical protein
MAGNHTGVIKTAAKRIGISVAVYLANIETGLKWCCKCRQWRQRLDFAKCSSESDGLQGECLNCNGKRRETRIRSGRGKLASLRTTARDGDKKQANARVQRLVDAGVIPHPRSVPCFDCGHLGSDRRHDYDHYLGYSVEHFEDVQAVCVKCHIKRGIARGELTLGLRKEYEMEKLQT